MKKLLFALLPAGCFLAGAVCNYCNASCEREAANEFRSFTESMFQREITSSTLNLHYTLEQPEKYGITDYPVTYGGAEAFSQASEDALTALDYQRALGEISYRHLSEENRITYDILMLALQNAADAQEFSLLAEPLGPTIGVQAQLPVLLAEYSFSDAADVDEYLELIAQTDTYFHALLQHERARAAAGLFMNSRNADAIISQCRAFVSEDSGQENLLIPIFEEKVDALACLSEAEKDIYKEKNRTAVAEHVLPAYKMLMEGLEALKGTCKNENGLCYFPSGKAYYEYLIRDLTGSYLPVAAVERRIRAQLAQDIQACRELVQKYPDAADEHSLSDILTDPGAILADLRQKMTADFPLPPDTDVEVKYVHESLEDFLSPAFYLTPPIDNPDENVIYINRASVSSPVELYTTLAHEGYPGHLYQNLCTPGGRNPVRSLFSFGGYTEGWATYVEMLSYGYAAGESASDLEKAAASYAQLNRSVTLGLSSLLDICIHYHGFTREDTAEFLSGLGFDNPAAADAIFDVILEAPVNYMKYYLGYLSFLDLRSYCQDNWPQKFDPADFHRQILRIGPAPFPVVEKYLKLYYRSL